MHMWDTQCGAIWPGCMPLGAILKPSLKSRERNDKLACKCVCSINYK